MFLQEEIGFFKELKGTSSWKFIFRIAAQFLSHGNVDFSVPETHRQSTSIDRSFTGYQLRMFSFFFH